MNDKSIKNFKIDVENTSTSRISATYFNVPVGISGGSDMMFGRPSQNTHHQHTNNKPTSKRQQFLDFCFLQNTDGSFVFDKQYVKLVNSICEFSEELNQDELESSFLAFYKTKINQELCASIIAFHLLEMIFIKYTNETSMIRAKLQHFLEHVHKLEIDALKSTTSTWFQTMM